MTNFENKINNVGSLLSIVVPGPNISISENEIRSNTSTSPPYINHGVFLHQALDMGNLYTGEEAYSRGQTIINILHSGEL